MIEDEEKNDRPKKEKKEEKMKERHRHWFFSSTSAAKSRSLVCLQLCSAGCSKHSSTLSSEGLGLSCLLYLCMVTSVERNGVTTVAGHWSHV